MIFQKTITEIEKKLNKIKDFPENIDFDKNEIPTIRMEKWCKYCGKDLELQATLTTLKEKSKQVQDILDNIDTEIPDDDGKPVNLSAEQFKEELKTQLQEL